nr:hypothetical protein [Streptomyces sp. NRRL S-813]
MAEALRHDRHVYARGERERRLTVAQVVKPNAAQAGRVDAGAEQLGHVVRAEWIPLLAGEHEAVVGVRLAPLLALGVPAHPVREQGADGGLVQVDDAVLTALGLRLAERHAEVPGGALRARRRRLLVLLPSGLLYDLLPDDDDPAGEVDVIPAQADRLTAAQAGTGDHLEHSAEAMRVDAVENAPSSAGSYGRTLGRCAVGRSMSLAALKVTRRCRTAVERAERRVA